MVSTGFTFVYEATTVILSSVRHNSSKSSRSAMVPRHRDGKAVGKLIVGSVGS